MNLKTLVLVMLKVRNFSRPLIDIFLPHFLREEYVLYLRDGKAFRLRPKKGAEVGDVDIFLEVVIEKEYPLSDHLMEGDIILDIGANIGLFSLDLWRRGIKIYSFEPVRENFRLLVENIKLNNADISARRLAISNKNGFERIFINSSNTGGHSTYLPSKKKEVVRCERISSILEKTNANIIKLDCEGAEYKILTSIKKNQLKKIDCIVFEQHLTKETLAAYSSKEIIDHLENSGFEVEILKKIFYEKEGEFWLVIARRGNRER